MNYRIMWWANPHLVEDFIQASNQIEAAEKFKAKHPEVNWFEYRIKISNSQISFLPKKDNT